MTTEVVVEEAQGLRSLGRPLLIAFFYTLLLVAAVILCHGCHGGDHDDELSVPAAVERH